MDFEWDQAKDLFNQAKHGVSFTYAQSAFNDLNRIILEDADHSQVEKRYFCYGKVGDGILTVRFTLRRSYVRITGVGYWRKGKSIYDAHNTQKIKKVVDNFAGYTPGPKMLTGKRMPDDFLPPPGKISLKTTAFAVQLEAAYSDILIKEAKRRRKPSEEFMAGILKAYAEALQ